MYLNILIHTFINKSKHFFFELEKWAFTSYNAYKPDVNYMEAVVGGNKNMLQGKRNQ